MADAGDRRFLVFLALSMALHALWLAVPLQHRASADATTLAPLDIRLVSPSPPAMPLEKSAVATRLGTSRNTQAAPASPATEPAAPVLAQEGVRVNLDAAFATARRLAKEAPAVAPVTPPQTAMAVAVAGALRTQETIETRGANGEYVTITGKTRCVTPLLVPHYLEGKTMLTQCEMRKG